MIQAGFSPSSSKPTPASSSAPAAVDAHADASTAPIGTKRKFILDQEELERIANEDRIKAKKSIEEEKVSYAVMCYDPMIPWVSCVLF